MHLQGLLRSPIAVQNTAIKKAMTHNLCDAPAEIQKVITKTVGARSRSIILASPLTLSDIFLDWICKKVSNLCRLTLVIHYVS